MQGNMDEQLNYSRFPSGNEVEPEKRPILSEGEKTSVTSKSSEESSSPTFESRPSPLINARSMLTPQVCPSFPILNTCRYSSTVRRRFLLCGLAVKVKGIHSLGVTCLRESGSRSRLPASCSLQKYLL